MPTAFEKETIILFNEAEGRAEIYTHSVAWQHHMEKKLGLKPIETNTQGGKTYEIDKQRIKPPRAPVKLSPEARVKLGQRLRKH